MGSEGVYPLRQWQFGALISAGLRVAYADISRWDVRLYLDCRFVRLGEEPLGPTSSLPGASNLGRGELLLL